MDKKILIVYIATGVYNEYYEDFIRTSTLFCPEVEKELCIFTDDIEFYSKFYGSYKPKNIIYINQQPWPLITLLKFHYIKEAYQKFKCTHVCYFNANALFTKTIAFNEFFSKDKLTVTEHWGWTTYGKSNVKDLLDDKFVVDDNLAFIPSTDYVYVNAGVVGGPKNIIEDCCDWIIESTNTDLKSGVIPRHHDESYLNKWVYDNPKRIKMMRSRFTYDSCRINEILQEFPDEFPSILYQFSNIVQKAKFPVKFTSPKIRSVTKEYIDKKYDNT